MTWTAVAGVLTALGAVWTVHAFRKRGPVSGLRGTGLTLLPVAAWATGSLEMFAEVSMSVVDWAAGFVFSPLAWIGIVVLGIAVLLFGTAQAMSARGVGGRPGRTSSHPPEQAGAGARKPGLPPASGPAAPVIDDDLDDIEAILRRRGIS